MLKRWIAVAALLLFGFPGIASSDTRIVAITDPLLIPNGSADVAIDIFIVTDENVDGFDIELTANSGLTLTSFTGFAPSAEIPAFLASIAGNVFTANANSLGNLVPTAGFFLGTIFADAGDITGELTLTGTQYIDNQFPPGLFPYSNDGAALARVVDLQQCFSTPTPTPTATPTPGPGPECNDGIDNDGDGRIDWPADRQCKSPSEDSERRPHQ
jgi:hypothetical protein